MPVSALACMLLPPPLLIFLMSRQAMLYVAAVGGPCYSPGEACINGASLHACPLSNNGTRKLHHEAHEHMHEQDHATCLVAVCTIMGKCAAHLRLSLLS